MIQFNQIEISLGSIIEKNTDISNLVGWSPDEIKAKTGISQRYISNKDENAETLAIRAAKKIDQELINKCELIISVTNTQSVDFPSIANIVHSHLGLTNVVKCIGINAGCTGFVDALEIAYAYFKSDFASNALIINSDTYSKYLGSERSTRTLFSDGASATFITKNLSGYDIKSKVHSSVKDTYDYLTKKNINETKQISMNGPQVLKFAISTVLKDLKSIPIDSECILVPHQAGKIVLDLLDKNFSNSNLILKNYEKYGNLVSASIPNLIKENFFILENKSILLAGFGVGLSHNSILLER